jgi:hypothetical protein
MHVFIDILDYWNDDPDVSPPKTVSQATMQALDCK